MKRMAMKPLIDLTKLFGTSHRRSSHQKPTGYRVYARPTRAKARRPEGRYWEQASRADRADSQRFNGRTYYNVLKRDEYYETKRQANAVARRTRNEGYNVRVASVRNERERRPR